MARTMPNAPSVSMAPHPFRDFTDLLEDVVMSRRRRAERRPGEFMADRSGNDRRRRSGLPLAWLVLLILVPLAGPAPSAAGPYREYEIRFIGEASPLGKSPSDADLINAVAWTMSNKLDLPFPVGTKAYIYVNQAAIVDGLIQIAGEERQQAWDKGSLRRGRRHAGWPFPAGRSSGTHASAGAHGALRPRADARQPAQAGRRRARRCCHVDPRGPRRLGQVPGAGAARASPVPRVAGRDRSIHHHFQDARQVLPRPAGPHDQRGLGQVDESARRPSHVWPGVPRRGLAHRALWECQAPRVPRTVRASGRASRTLADGLLDC